MKSRNTNGFTINMSNMSDKEIILKEGTVVGELEGGVSVLHGNGENPATGSGKEWRNTRISQESVNLGENLSGKQKKELTNILQNYESVFYRGGKLPVVQIGVEHTIKLKSDTAPIACRPRRLP